MFSLAIAAVAGLLGFGAVLTHVAARRISQQYPPIGEFVDVGGVRLHLVDEAGPEGDDRPPLVVIHGASANLREPMLAFAGHLRQRQRTLFIDRPGHGWSERRGRADASPSAQAALIAAALKAKGIERAVILGISWGGALAAAFAVNHPQQTAGLVFIGPATHPWPGGVDWHYGITVTPVLGTLFSHCLMLPIAWNRVPRAVEGVFSPEAAPTGYSEAIGARLLLRPAEFIANGEDVHDLKANVTALAPRYREIVAPTEIVTGDADAVVWPSIHSVGLERDIAGANVTWLPGAGHMPHHTRRADVLAAIERVYGRMGRG